ncbi:hypothetical protein PaG_04769 [Moesziomyces aphidis]|uniref:Tr-type G domain-containing protein n=1 Tax=Moesziomyces aphidis TaxID=84754 RepID=W3VJ75_MOEAP|nr:hypothetical protein PaG_04769 [Moesziomyces aphidis]
MLSRSTLSIASARRAGWAAPTSSARLALASTSAAPAATLRTFVSSSPVESGRGGAGDRPSYSNRDADRNNPRRPRNPDAGGNAVQQFSRNQRFAPDGTRKRLPHPNARPRSQHGKDRGEPRSQRPQRDDESMHKFGSAEPSSSSASSRRDSTVSRIRARNTPSAAGQEGEDSRFGESEPADAVAGSGTRGDDEGISSGSRAFEKSDRHHAAKQKKKEGRGSLLDADTDHRRGAPRAQQHESHTRNALARRSKGPVNDASGAPEAEPEVKRGAAKPKIIKVKRNLFLPEVISVIMLATRMEKKLRAIQTIMADLGMQDTRPDCMLKFEDAEMIAAEFNVVAIANDEASFDLFPRPPPETEEERVSFPLRPPVVTIMGHVDHGKTTLLDKLRSTSVAAGEAGGITQHIGAFSVPISGVEQDKGKRKGYKGIQTITFLDTPGHAAFTAMRSRGAMVTDIVVLVVAADDGVMPQTREVIKLVHDANAEAASSDGIEQHRVQMIVALNKVDKTDADPERVKRELLAAGVELEELGGDIPCVLVSGKTGKGLDELEETIAAVAELADLRAEKVGLPEGYVIESRVDKGRGNVATVLMKRGELVKGASLIAGTSWCRVRAILHSGGRPLARAFPGDPVLVAGWKSLPTAGDLMLGATDEASCKKAIENRKKAIEQKRLLQDVEQINEARRIKAELEEAEARKEFEERQRRRAARLAASDGKDPLAAIAELDEAAEATPRAAPEEQVEVETSTEPEAVGKKMLNVIVKADFSGTVEAVVGAIASIGNAEAGVKIVSATVGEPSEGDVAKAAALDATIIGFNVNPSKSVLQAASRTKPTPVRIIASDVIYRLMESVSTSVAELLPPLMEPRVQGEAVISQIFDINLKKNATRKIAGCKVTNGTISKSVGVRILRGKDRTEVYRGRLDQFKHLKKDVTEMRKGTECGMAFEGFQDIQPDDVVQSFTEVAVPRTL